MHKLSVGMTNLSGGNDFVKLLAAALSDHASVRSMKMRNLIFGPNRLVMHWTDGIVAPSGIVGRVRSVFAILLLFIYWIRGGRLYVVVHNLRPHDARMDSLFVAAFTKIVYGYIHLNKYSMKVYSRHRLLRRKRNVCIRHGSYAGLVSMDMAHEATDRSILTFGEIRRYKSLETVITISSNFPDHTFFLVGRATDANYAAEIENRSREIQNLSLDFRNDLLEFAELVTRIQLSVAIVLPYRRVLNSGAAILALTCGKPIMLPRTPAFQQLLDDVGPHWVYLYEAGEEGPTLRRLLSESSLRSGRNPDLRLYDWSAQAKILVGEMWG